MEYNAPLCEEDMIRVVALLGEVCAHEGEYAEKKSLLIDGMCRLAGADAWVWGVFVQLRPGEFPSYMLHLHGGFTEETLARYFDALAHPDTARFTVPFAKLMEEKKCHLTRYRQQYTEEEDYAVSEARKAWERAEIEPGILSCRPINPTTLSTVGIYRRPGREAFTERESRMVHILLSEVPWLHERGWSAEDVAPVQALSPRRCTVLNLLVQGRNRDEIAAHLAISRHTVNDYVKDLFLHFGVHSQPELIARFQSGDAGDVP